MLSELESVARDGEPFDLLKADDAFRANPYPTYRRLRDQAPLSQNSDGSYVVTRWADVAQVLGSSDSSVDKSDAMKRVMGEGVIVEYHLNNITAWDPPRHGRTRRSLAHAFTPRAMTQWTPLIEEAVDELLREAEARGRIDLVSDFAAMLPLTLICKMLGVPKAEKDLFRGWANSITSSLDPVVSSPVIATANRHAEEWKNYFSELIIERRKRPGNDLVSMLLTTPENEEPLSELALLHNLALLLSAGHETTTSLITNAIDSLFVYPAEAERLRKDASLFETSVEEFLRFESPVQMGARRATAPISLSGGVASAGSLIWTIQGAANRDERQFADPDKLDVGRRPNRQLAFATGIHVCLGAPLARLEARVALERLVCGFPHLRPDGAPKRYLRTRYRGFSTYPIAFD